MQQSEHSPKRPGGPPRSSRPITARTPHTPHCCHLSLFLFLMAPVPSRTAILRLINASQNTSCPCHGSHTAHNSHAIVNQLRTLATPVDKVEKEYAFEVYCALLLLTTVIFIIEIL